MIYCCSHWFSRCGNIHEQCGVAMSDAVLHRFFYMRGICNSTLANEYIRNTAAASLPAIPAEAGADRVGIDARIAKIAMS